MTVYFLGYMGSGKSTLGQQVAKEMGFDFVDLDEVVSTSTGFTISEIFEEQGEEGFRQIEWECIKAVSQRENVLISLGGGTPTNREAMKLINSRGTSVYLKCDVETLYNRLASSNNRPMLQQQKGVALKSHIEKMLQDREPFYRQADYTIGSSLHYTRFISEFIVGLKK